MHVSVISQLILYTYLVIDIVATNPSDPRLQLTSGTTLVGHSATIGADEVGSAGALWNP